MGPEESSIGRPNFLRMTGAGFIAAGTGATATQALASNASVNSETSAAVVPQPSPEFAPDLTTADIMVETLISWGYIGVPAGSVCKTLIAVFRF
jgi:hypothetical protein